MGANGRVNDGSDATLLNGLPSVRLTTLVLGEENATGHAVLKAHHAVLPVTHMVSETQADHSLPQIIAVKEEPKSINDARALIHKDKSSWRLGIAVGIWFVAARNDLLLLFARAGRGSICGDVVVPGIRDTMHRMLLVHIKPSVGLAMRLSTVPHGRRRRSIRVIEWARQVIMAMEPTWSRFNVLPAVKRDHLVVVAVECLQVVQ